jgi:hypothetical protein
MYFRRAWACSAVRWPLLWCRYAGANYSGNPNKSYKMYPVIGTIDLTGVTGPIGDLSTALVTAAGVAITAGLAVAALYFGGRWVWRVFKSFTR